MNLNQLRSERKEWLTWKNIAPLRQILKTLPQLDTICTFGDTVTIQADCDTKIKNKVHEAALALRPWRKGPFQVLDTFIDSEWNSALKYNLLEPYFDLKDKRVADIGCNN